jgi:predicted  nucleic acid-binding Zn-ribbon protein
MALAHGIAEITNLLLKEVADAKSAQQSAEGQLSELRRRTANIEQSLASAREDLIAANKSLRGKENALQDVSAARKCIALKPQTARLVTVGNLVRFL